MAVLRCGYRSTPIQVSRHVLRTKRRVTRMKYVHRCRTRPPLIWCDCRSTPKHLNPAIVELGASRRGHTHVWQAQKRPVILLQVECAEIHLDSNTHLR